MISRRDLLRLSGAAALSSSLPALAGDSSPADYRLDIAETTVELSPHHRLRTVAYNDQVPGPLLRMKEGRPVSIEVSNRTDRAEVVHWHGLFLPPAIDGSLEEGTPAIAAGASARYTFTPNPPGFRWYHTHGMAMGDLTRGLYSGQHGLLMIEPRDNPGRYDREFFLTLHDWKGYLSANEDGAMNPAYAVATINGKVFRSGEPLRVVEGERVLVHVLNSSPTEVHWLALSGHELHVIALDGNPVATSRSVPMLRLAPAERICAILEANNPGVWVLGEVRRHVRAAGMAVVIEYAGRHGEAQWQQPQELRWSYAVFAGVNTTQTSPPRGEPPEEPVLVPLVFEPKFRGHGAMEGWMINGKSYPEASIAALLPGRRYRLQFINRSQDDHPLHLHRHSFELCSLGSPLDGGHGAPPPSQIGPPADDIRGIIKDVVLVDAQTRAEVEFTANHPGATLFHCHQQSHMDLGFMMLMHYA